MKISILTIFYEIYLFSFNELFLPKREIQIQQKSRRQTLFKISGDHPRPVNLGGPLAPETC